MTPINRFLQIFNLSGVAALAVLATFQWQANSRATLAVQQLDRTRAEQSAKLAEQQTSLDQANAQVDQLHQRLTTAESARDAAQLQLAESETDRQKLRQILTTWQAALAARDAALRHAADEIQTVARQRDDALRRINAAASAASHTGTGS